jgi:ABC-type nitrate/sulfonate/bicarbonate transport system ATPase subunit
MLDTRSVSSSRQSQTSASGTQPKMQVVNLRKAFSVGGQKEPLLVLQDVSFEIHPREFVCLVGASGCGKSTLLNIAAGLAAPSAGQILVDGIDVTGRPGSDRGMVFQGYTLYPWLTVLQNVAFGLQLRRLPKPEQRARAAYFLDVVGLTQFANAYPKQLSGGMKQRVAIARALANEPEVLLMDEPFGALDAQTKEQMQQFLLGLWEKTHVTILMITHDVEEAIFLAQRVHVMGSHPGRIKQTIQTDLPEHHDLEIKLTRDFIQLKREILQALREEPA